MEKHNGRDQLRKVIILEDHWQNHFAHPLFPFCSFANRLSYPRKWLHGMLEQAPAGHDVGCFSSLYTDEFYLVRARDWEAAWRPLEVEVAE
jgi:hypothetical protein